MTVLVTGGAGYIGSHTVLELLRAGYDVVAADDLSNSSPEALRRVEKLAGKSVPLETPDLCELPACEALFQKYSFDAVIHFAAFKAVGESVEQPLKYYSNNLICALNVLKCMKKYGVSNFVFSSSATVYGDPEKVPIPEDAPLHVESPYGRTKLMIEDMLRDIAKAENGFSAAILRYFNPIGADESGLIGEDPNGIPNNLVPYISQVAVGRLECLSVYGNDYPTPDGTGVRDYIHVTDLAKGHIAALKSLEKNPRLLTCNLGTGRGYSVLEVVAAFEKACGRKIPYRFAPRRGGDVPSYYADATRAKNELGFTAELDIDKMCADSWNWQKKNPNGYEI